MSAFLRTFPLTLMRGASSPCRAPVALGMPTPLRRSICHSRCLNQGVVHNSDSGPAATSTPERVKSASSSSSLPVPELPQRVFDNLTFPAKFTLKIIGVDDASFISDTLATLAKIVGINNLPAESLSMKPKGKYLSITATPVFSNSSQIYACYAKLKEDPRVKFVL
jgi:putative lipoic acid-binding regulatory protein